MDHFDQIYDALLFPPPRDADNDLDDNTKATFRNLLLDLDPSRLEHAIITYPRMQDVERIWTILEARRKRQHPVHDAPPLRIMVVGGSVTEGVDCQQMDTIVGRACSWPARLESFINRFLGYDAVQITNIAQGGTNTDQALNIIKYWIYPTQLQDKAPDVIIHAFGANDSHLGSVPSEERERIMQLHEQGVRRLNDFIHTVQRSHSCPTPIVIHLDDYFGGKCYWTCLLCVSIVQAEFLMTKYFFICFQPAVAPSWFSRSCPGVYDWRFHL
jgi:hypothetical protein